MSTLPNDMPRYPETVEGPCMLYYDSGAMTPSRFSC